MATTTTTTRKPTKRQMFEQILSHLTDPAEREFVQHELELLAKKNSGEKKPTAVQIANEAIKSAIMVGVAEKGSAMTVSDMIKEIPACAGLSNPKVSALVTQLREDGKLVRTEVKRRAFFGLPEWQTEGE